MTIYLQLLIAIIAEVVGTTLLKSSAGFSRLLPTVGSLACYGVAFYFLSLTLEHIPTGIAYALWSGIGIVLVSLFALFWHGQKLDAAAIIGLTFIVIGVLIINVFSHSAGH